MRERFGSFLLGPCNPNLVWNGEYFWINIPNSENLKSCFETFLLKIKLLLLRNSYICPIWSFIFDTDQGTNVQCSCLSPISDKNTQCDVSHNEELPVCVCVPTLIIIRCLSSLCVNNLLSLRWVLVLPAKPFHLHSKLELTHDIYDLWHNSASPNIPLLTSPY